MKNLVLGAAALVMSLAAAPAMAGNVVFTLTDNHFGGTLTWELPEAPVPPISGFGQFTLIGPFLGGATDPEFGEGYVAFDNFTFYDEENFGGFSTYVTGFFPYGYYSTGALSLSDGGYYFEFDLSTAGPQLFSGSVEAPTFLRGTFDLDDYCGCVGISAVEHDYSLTISDAVPEPAAWALMIAGFGATGVLLRRRRALAA